MYHKRQLTRFEHLYFYENLPPPSAEVYCAIWKPQNRHSENHFLSMKILTVTNLLQNLFPLFLACFRSERMKSHLFPVHSFQSSGVWVTLVLFRDAGFHCSKKLLEVFRGPFCSQCKHRKFSQSPGNLNHFFSNMCNLPQDISFVSNATNNVLLALFICNFTHQILRSRFQVHSFFHENASSAELDANWAELLINPCDSRKPDNISSLANLCSLAEV